MADYPQLTPPLRGRGRFKVREPFRISADVDYTCIAIRTFKDMYREGTNPYTAIYSKVGLIDGATFNNETFSFSREEDRGINIITLADDLGRSFLIPDNYITSFPSSTSVEYREIILSCSLGALPIDTDITLAQQAIIDAVGAQFGITPSVLTHSLSTLNNPTYEEHLALEQARFAAMENGTTSNDIINGLRDQIEVRDKTILTLTQILKDNNLLPT